MTTAKQEATGPSKIIASEVRAEMGRRGMTRRSIASSIGVSHAWVQRRIAIGGDVEITFEDAERLASALGVPVMTLLDPYLRAWRDSNPQPSDREPAPVLRLVRPSPVTNLPRTRPVAAHTRRTRRHLASVVDGLAS